MAVAHNVVPHALPPLQVCQQARLSRDPRFDGRFFIAVLSTGIYCRTICPARMPKEENVRYFLTAAQAQDAGFRACRRCRPQTALSLPEWTLSSDTVLRAMRMIEAGYLNANSTAQLAAEFDLGERQLSRLFQSELGASPKAIAQMCRARLAYKLLRDSDLKLTDVAFHAGFGSISSFNSEVKKAFAMPPREIRGGRASNTNMSITVQLPLRGPYDFHWMFDYLQQRALTGIEEVQLKDVTHGEYVYRRRLPGATPRWVEVRTRGRELEARLPVCDEPLHSLLTRIRRVFDLNSDGATIHNALQDDALLGSFVRARPGLRVPGAWSGFETAARAILGQQVSVQRGTVLAGKMIDQYGDGDFPAPETVMLKEVGEIGMPGRRGRAISELARLVADGSLTLDDGQNADRVQEVLLSIDGIGPWTVNYIRMRVLRDPDAFPDNDWVVMKALDASAAESRKRATAWQPWRAYALMYLWHASPVLRGRQDSVA